MHVIIHLFKPTKYITRRVSPSVNQGLSVKMMGKHVDLYIATKMEAVGDGGGYVCVGAGSL